LRAWFEKFVQVGLEADTRSLFVALTMLAIADDIGEQNGGEPALHLR
jgi:hypothetical protein